MRIVIDIDEDAWGGAFCDWDELNETPQKWATHTKAVRARLVSALAMPIERIKFVEEPEADDESEDGDDED